MIEKRFTIEDYYELSPNDVINIINKQNKVIKNTKELLQTILQIAIQNGVISKTEIEQVINND